jgi:hypothetical protein
MSSKLLAALAAIALFFPALCLPALSWLCAYQRRGVQHARVPARLRLQGGAADGARASL